MNAQEQEQQKRLLALVQLGLLEAESVPVFEEATQTAAHYLEVPICILGLMDRDYERFKAAVGLSRLGLMNELATTRLLPRSESFCARVVDSCKTITIGDIGADPAMSRSLLFERYGICAYLGVPLMMSSGHCLGTLAVMDLEPRTFTSKEIQYLEIAARWISSEFERDSILKASFSEKLANRRADRDRDSAVKPATSKIESTDTVKTGQPTAAVTPPTIAASPLSAVPQDAKGEVSRQAYRRATDRVKAQLLNQLTQELRTPLTSVMGMASVLSRETYGPLIGKQKEYLDIIRDSGQYLLSLVNEILELGAIDNISQELALTSVDVEMLCQQAMGSLEHLARRQNQQIRLSVEPGNRIWLLDKLVVRQILYHLVSSVIQSATAESVVRIHLSRKNNGLNMAIWVSHPWLGEGLPDAELESYHTALPDISHRSDFPNGPNTKTTSAEPLQLPQMTPLSVAPQTISQPNTPTSTSIESNGPIASSKVDERTNNEGLELVVESGVGGTIESLRILLSRQLVQIHGGVLSVQGSTESGYRYVVNLPDLTNRSEQ